MLRAMPARQLWAFLTRRDVSDLIARIAAREEGLVWSEGRYLRGDPAALLEDPARLERREALPAERRLYLLHRKHCRDIVVHPQPAGPFKGWSQIDEDRTDCLVLRLKEAAPGELEPAQLYAQVTFWRAGDKVRKRPMFSIWASQTLKWAEAQLPPTAAKMLRIGADALAKANAGELKLVYLYRPVAPLPREKAVPR